MIIDGDLVPMEPGDRIPTPGWAWHGHVHPGAPRSAGVFLVIEEPRVLT
jgi:gentisate 1,2-dioxygenase